VELDAWGGRTLVSVVGFLFSDTRVLGVPVPWHRHFIEVNLRFYVRRVMPDEVRRGVVFVKEIVPRRAIAWVARWLYNEPYVAMPMRAEVREGHVAYAWRARHGWQDLRVERAGEPALVSEDSEEAFITEHYWGYCRQRDGGCVEYRVTHPRWPLWRGRNARVNLDFGRLYGPEFGGLQGAEAVSAFIAVGSEVAVLKPTRLRV
jgi:uncharacterized protein YqjF (DUF2071 family)